MNTFFTQSNTFCILASPSLRQTKGKFSLRLSGQTGEIPAYHNHGFMRHCDTLCNTGDTQGAVVYHFFEFVLHKKVIGRTQQHVSSIVIRFPGGKHLSWNRQPKRQPNRQPAHAITYRVARPFPSVLIRFCSTI